MTAQPSFRSARSSDVRSLAAMNQQSILDEGHRNRMTQPELERRMTAWLADGHQAHLIAADGQDVGYALYKLEPEWVYLRQFFIRKDQRRQGIGRAAVHYLRGNAWNTRPRLRVEVDVENIAALAFWRALGFADRALTLEWE